MMALLESVWFREVDEPNVDALKEGLRELREVFPLGLLIPWLNKVRSFGLFGAEKATYLFCCSSFCINLKGSITNVNTKQLKAYVTTTSFSE